MTAQSCVYFIHAENDNLIKVGVANDVRRRLRSLQLMNAGPVTLLGVIPGDRYTERDLHLRFHSIRAHGEWFRAADDLLGLVARVAVPVEELPYVVPQGDGKQFRLASTQMHVFRNRGAGWDPWNEGFQVLYTQAEVAELLGCSERTANRLIESGAVRSVPMCGRAPIRVPASALGLYLDRAGSVNAPHPQPARSGGGATFTGGGLAVAPVAASP